MVVTQQHHNLTFDFIALFHSGNRVLSSYKIDNLVKIEQSLWEPLQNHGVDFPA